MRLQLTSLLCLFFFIQQWVMAESALASPASTADTTDTDSATPAGTTFKLPTGWTSRTVGNLVVLSPPERDFKIGLVDLDEAQDAAAAVAAGWAAFDPEFKRPLRIAAPQAPREGWDERQYFDYQVAPNEKLGVTAYVWRAGAHWLVVMQRGSQATQEKRAGPISLVMSSLRPAGYQREILGTRTAHTLDEQKIQVLKDFLADGMQQLGIPGVGFSLIDDGKIVYEGGVGVRELGKPDKVDANTLFIAASNTKALTTLLLAELVDEKKLSWEEPVTQAYPSFKLGDAATTRRVQIKHLICACTGMPRQDYEWIFGHRDATPASAVASLGMMQPTSRFGEVFQYSNLMAAAAGFIGGAIAEPGKEIGAAYDDAMQKKVFGPLGMTHSTFNFTRALKGNHARPHDVDIDGKPAIGVQALNYTVIPARPAGGLWTSSHDLSQYVLMELAKGQLPNGKPLVSEQNLLQRRVPNVIVSEDITYGMGLMVDKRWGVTIIHHGGDLAGYHSDMIWLPFYGVGATILTNSDTGWALRGPFLRKLVELLFDAKPEADTQLKVAAQQLDDERRDLRKHIDAPADAIAVGKLAASYRNDDLGSIAVKHKGKNVVFEFGSLKSVMATHKNDDGSLSFISISPTLQGFEFVVAERDGKRALITRDAQHEYVFVDQRSQSDEKSHEKIEPQAAPADEVSPATPEGSSDGRSDGPSDDGSIPQ